MTTDGRPGWQHGNQEVTQETEAAKRQGGRMTPTNSKNCDIKMCVTSEGGESWERPTSNNGPINSIHLKLVNLSPRVNFMPHWNSTLHMFRKKAVTHYIRFMSTACEYSHISSFLKLSDLILIWSLTLSFSNTSKTLKNALKNILSRLSWNPY